MSVSNSDFISQFITAASHDAQIELLKNAGAAELVDLFEKTLLESDQSIPEEGKMIQLQQIIEREQSHSLSPELLNRITTVSLQKLCNLTLSDKPELRESLIDLLKKNINEENIGELIACSFNIRSEDLLNQCFEYLKSKTRITFRCENFGPVSIKIGQLNSNQDIESLTPYLNALKNSLKGDKIRLILKPSASVNIEAFKNFVLEHRLLIHSLNIKKIDVDEETLQFLLQGTTNLHHLFIQSTKINGNGVGLQELAHLEKLQSLDMSYCSALESPPDVRNCTQLQRLDMSYCSALESPPDVRNCTLLQNLDMSSCSAVENPPDVQNCTQLQKLNMSDCSALESPPDVRNCAQLQSLDMSSCSAVETPPDMRNCTLLQSLDMSFCSALKSPPDVQNCTQLLTLSMYRCSAVETPPDVRNCTQLQNLNISYCSDIKIPPDVRNCTRLQRLYMSYCSALESLPDVQKCTQLQILNMRGCNAITREAVHQVVNNLIEANPSILMKIGWGAFNLTDTTSFELKIAQKDLDLYLNNLNKFNPPNQEARLHVLENLIETDPEKALKYALNLKITNKEKLKELILRIQEIQTFIEQQTIPQDFDPIDLLGFYTFYQTIEKDDIDSFIQSLSTPLFHTLKIKNEELKTREFFEKHRVKITQNNRAFEMLKELYPPNIEGNSRFYPITGSVNQGNIQISCSLFAPFERTKEMLQLLSELIAQRHEGALPNTLKIRFLEEHGVDAGGLGRQFISDLFRGLLSNKEKTTEISLRKRESNGLYLPVQRPRGKEMQLQDQEVAEYEQLGKVLAFLLGSSREYPTGQMFDSEMFNLLMNLDKDDVAMTSEMYQEKLKNRNFQEFLALCDPIIDHDQGTDPLIRQAEIVSNCESFDALPQEIKEDLSWYDISADNFKNVYLDMLQEKYLSTFASIQAIARGLSASLPIVSTIEQHEYIATTWDELKEIGAVRFDKHIQGVLTKDKLKEAIEVSSPDEEKSAEVKMWFNEWIDAADEHQMKLLLQYITGSPGLSGKIRINVNSLHTQFMAHTCFSSLDFPLQVEKAAFQEFLNDTLLVFDSSKGFSEI